MAQKIGALVVDLIAETASFNANMTKAAATLNTRSLAMQRSLDGIQKKVDGLKNVGQALAGMLAVRELTGAVNRALDYASSLGELSQQLGVTTRDLQVYRYAASQTGISQEEMEKGLAKLSVTAGQAALGMQAQAGAFDALGISVRDSNGHVKTAGQLIPEIAERLSRVTDPAQRAAAEVALFGRAGQKLDPLLTQGAKGVNELAQRATDLGMVMGDDLVNSADAAADRIAELKMQLDATFARTVAQNADAILGMANALATMTARAVDFIAKYPELSGAMAGVAVGSRAGLPGAIAGGALGMAAGRAAKPSDDDNMDLKFRKSKLAEAGVTYREIMAKYKDWPKNKPNLLINLATEEVIKQDRLNQRALRKAATPTAPLSPALAGGGGDLPQFLKTGDNAAKQAADDAKRLTEQYEKQLADLQQTLKVEQLRQSGLSLQANLVESEANIRERFRGLDDDRLKKLLDQNSAIEVQRYLYEEIAKTNSGDLMPDKPLYVMPEADIQKKLDDVTGYNRQAAQKVQANWVDATHGILYAFDDLASGIKGNFFQAVQGALDLFLQLGSVGAFGDSLQSNITSMTSMFGGGGGFGFASGGYTGGTSASEIRGYVHGKEYVFDAAATARIGADNLERIRRGAGFMKGGYVGGRAASALTGVDWRKPVIHVEASPFFDVTVQEQAKNVAAPMSQRAAMGGAALAEQSIARRRRNKIPGRMG